MRPTPQDWLFPREPGRSVGVAAAAAAVVFLVLVVGFEVLVWVGIAAAGAVLLLGVLIGEWYVAKQVRRGRR